MEAEPRYEQLNKQQLEILKLFSRELDDTDLLEIKRLITSYLAQKVTALADEVWEQKEWTDQHMDQLLNTHQRTPYNPKNKQS